LTVYTFFRSEVPYSEGQITFNILSPEPVTRPAYNKFYETPELHDFVEASLVRVKLVTITLSPSILLEIVA
jgi:hypothetical protein